MMPLHAPRALVLFLLLASLSIHAACPGLEDGKCGLECQRRICSALVTFYKNTQGHAKIGPHRYTRAKSRVKQEAGA